MMSRAKLISAGRVVIVVGAVVGLASCERVVDPACEQYRDCQAAFDDVAGGEATDTSIYAEEGDCWAGDPTTAERCAAECLEALTVLQDAATSQGLDIDACVADDADDADDTEGGA